MIVRAAVCPSPPLLARQLTGQTDVFPELRAACAAAVSTLLAAVPDVVVVVGAGPATTTWDPDDRLDPSAYAPALGTAGKPGLPLALGLGAMLLDAAGHAGPRVLQAVRERAPGGECLRLGTSLPDLAPRVGLLAMGDGSARRSTAAPGHLDPEPARSTHPWNARCVTVTWRRWRPWNPAWPGTCWRPAARRGRCWPAR